MKTNFNRFFLGLLIIISLGLYYSAYAGPKDFVIYVTRMGGDTESAKPYITRFAAYIEGALDWKKRAFQGSFFSDKQGALDFIKSRQPGLGVLDPALYFELKNSKQLTALAQIESKDLVSKRLHLVVKNPDFKQLADLKGKKLWTLLTEYPIYLSKVVFNGEVQANTHFSLKRIGQALKGIRAVLRGEADATLLDDDQLAQARKMSGGSELRTIFSSPLLPAIPVVVFGSKIGDKEQKELLALLLKMCSTEKGSVICKNMGIERFAPLQSQILLKTQNRYDK